MARRFRGYALILSSIFGLATTVPSANAQTFRQPNTGTSGNWSSAALWTPGVPTSGTTTALTFQTLGGNANAFVFTNDIGPFTVNSLSFNNFGSGLFTVALGANPLTLDGTNPFLSNNGPGNNLISGAGGVVLNANTAITGNGNGYLSISSVVSGTGGFTVNQTGNGIFSLTGANTFTGGVTLNSGYLQLGNATALGDAFTALIINGGALRFSSAVTIANNITANSTLVVAGGSGALAGGSTPTLSGIISGSNGLTIQNYATTSGLTLTNANTLSGAVNIVPFIPNTTASAGTLTLSGANGSLLNATSFTVGRNATLTLGGTTANANRVSDTAPIAVNNGTINYLPVTGGTNETLGNLTITGGLRLGTTAVGLSQMNFGTLTRTDNAVLWLTGTGFGTINSATVATLPTFTGGISTADNLSAGAQTQIGILPFAVSSSPTNPRSFVTYDATNGLTVVPYNNATYVTATTAGTFAADVGGGTLTNRNIHMNGAGAYNLGGANLTVNALTTTGSTVTISNGTINIFSGVFVNFDSVIWDTGATLNFPSTGYIHQSWNNVFRNTAQITGSNGLVVSGYSTGTTGVTTFENTNGNPFTGGLFVNGNSAVGFRQDNQLGAAAGDITLSGGGLAYNAAADLTVSRNIKINNSGYVSNNLVGTGGTAGNATATTVLTLSGVVSGNGALIKEGTGILNLSGTNTYSGGTVLTAGTLQFTSDANLGAAGTKITLNGGTLAPLAAITVSRPIDVNASTTINAANALTLSGTLTNVGSLYGTALPTLTKIGAGNLTISGNANQLSGNLTISVGSLTLGGSGTNGGVPLVSNITLFGNTTFTIDNATTGHNSNRIGDLAAITMGGAGSVVSYLAPTTATADPAEQFGVLNNTIAGGVFSVTGSAAGGTILRFNSLNATAGLTLRGDDLGGVTLGAGVTRILIDAFTTNQSVLPNVFFANTAGTGTSTSPAGYDLTRGIILFTPTPVTGSSINNFAPDNVPTTAAYTTNANATASTGVQIYSLTLDGGSTLTLNGGNAASGTNNNTPDGTLSIAGGILTSQNGAKTIDSAVARIVDFGVSNSTITTTSDLTLGANVSLTGSGALTKAGAGTLTLAGPYGITGPLTVSAGTIAFGQNATVLNPTGTGTIDLGTTTLTVNTTAATTFSGAIAGTTGALTKTGTGIFTFSPSAAYTPTGTTNINGGTFVIGNTNAAPILNNYALNAGIIDLNGNPAATLPTIAGGTANGVTNSNTTTASVVTAAVPVDQALAVAFSGNVNVNKTGAGILTLTGTGGIANPTTTGVVNVNEGTLLLTGAGQGLGSGMSVNVANGAIFRLTFNASAASGPFGTITLNGTGEWQNTDAPAPTNGQWSDPTINRLAFNGGRVNFTNTNTAGTFVSLNTVNGQSPSITSVASSITAQAVTTNAVDRITNASSAILPVTVAQGTTPSGIDLEINFGMFGANGFLKQGPGTLRLFGNASASTAPFTVSGGTLLAGGTGTGTGIITVNGTGTLRGTGTSTGVTTVSAGGKIGGGDPTTPIGTLTSTANVTIGANGSLRTVANSLSQSSQVTLTGATTVLNLNPGAGNTFGIEIISDTANPLVFGTPYTITLASVGAGGNFQLNSTSLPGNTNIAPANFVLSSPTFTAFNSVSLDVSPFGTDLILQFTPVPEPATVLGLAALGLAGVGAFRRRFRSKAVVA